MKHTEEIDRYLEGSMSSAERLAFEQRLAGDTSLAQELALQQKIYQSLRDKEAIAFHEKLEAIRKKKETAGQRKTSFGRAGLVLIVLALLTAVLLYWYLIPPKATQSIPPSSIPAEIPESLQIAPPPVAVQPKENDTAPPPRREPGPSVRSTKLLALAEKQYQNNLYSTIDRGIIRSNTKLNTQTDSVVSAFDRKDYPAVLQIAKNYPENDPSYHAVIWIAANAAFLQYDCQSAILYSKQISAFKDNKAKARDAEMLLLLSYIKCGMTNEPQYLELLGQCEADRSHPAHQLAVEIKDL